MKKLIVTLSIFFTFVITSFDQSQVQALSYSIDRDGNVTVYWGYYEDYSGYYEFYDNKGNRYFGSKPYRNRDKSNYLYRDRRDYDSPYPYNSQEDY